MGLRAHYPPTGSAPLWSYGIATGCAVLRFAMRLPGAERRADSGTAPGAEGEARDGEGGQVSAKSTIFQHALPTLCTSNAFDFAPSQYGAGCPVLTARTG